MCHHEDYKVDWKVVDRMIREAKKRTEPSRRESDDRPIVHADIGYGGDTGE